MKNKNYKSNIYSFRADPFLIECLKNKYMTTNLSNALEMCIYEALMTNKQDNNKSLCVRPVFSIMGSKSKTMVSNILDIMPKHKTFVDVFGGSGAILLAKPSSEFEIYNDKNKELTNFLKVIKTNPLEFYIKASSLFAADTILEEQKNSKVFDSPIDQAVNYFYLMATTIYGNKTSLKHGLLKNINKSYINRLQFVENVSKRLENVSILNRDFSYIIKTYDSSETLFYADPPYLDTMNSYGSAFTIEHHKQLAELLKKAQGKFILSHYADTEIYKLYRSRKNWHRTYKVYRKSGQSRLTYEKVITNFCFQDSEKLI